MADLIAGPSVADRVVDVLEAFAGDRSNLTLSEISRRAALPLTTTHRLVAALAGRGLLQREESGHYHLGLRLWEIAARAPHTVELRDAALPFLEDLYAATRENVQLAVRDGADAVFVELLTGRSSVHVLTRVGGRLPLHATGVGLVLLAHAEHEEQQAVLGGGLHRFTRFTVTDPRRLRRMLADVRRDGYAVSDRQIETISLSVAAPVYRAPGQVVAALSVVVPARGSDPRVFVPAVVAAARGISRDLAAAKQPAR